MMNNSKSETIELNLLLEAVYAKYGYDFRNYSKASVRRRVMSVLAETNSASLSELQHKILYHPEIFEQLLQKLSVNVTEMFRDPEFYQALREQVIPELKKKASVKIWHAGCASGEEAYSLAILLQEEGVYDKCYLYATDIDDTSLQKAREGIYRVKAVQEYTANYNRSGGIKSLGDYFRARYDHAILNKGLKKNILFSNHNLATDAVFGEMDMILCRNVLIYFNRKLQDRVLRMFKESLGDNGYLCLGSKETVRVSKYSKDFEDVAASWKIYRKVAHGR